MKDAKLKSALADYVQANPILSSLSGAAVATVFIYPLLILLTGIFHVSGLSQLNSLAMYLFWGSVVLLYAGNNGMFLTIGLGIQALMELISLFVMLFSYGSYFSVNALVEVLVTGTLAFLAFRGFSQTAEFAQMRVQAQEKAAQRAAERQAAAQKYIELVGLRQRVRFFAAAAALPTSRARLSAGIAGNLWARPGRSRSRAAAPKNLRISF